ncbi:MAG TPA: hypothetical protein VFS18_04840, partial [Actinomycetota bacterium]|nr:hypothetical protein [Actinomycetota bacterium]
LVTSENVESVGRLAEGAGAISMQFSSDTPHMYLSTLKGLQIYDISDPKAPELVGAEVLPHYQNEAMSLGERGKNKFVIIASTQAGASTTGDVDTSSRRIWVVDVTDPANPEVVGSTATDTRTHTVSCLTKSCEYAYSDGRTQGAISIIDLRDITAPKMVGTYESVVPQGHDQDVDEAGLVWHVGGQGAVALDVSKPTKPVPVASTNGFGVESADREGQPWNNFILHNSARPHAKSFKTNAAPSLKNGNILMATEEDTGVGECGPEYGSFSTWHIPYLDAGKYKKDNPELKFGNGRIAPLDLWYPEDAGVYGHACSAHYFDYNEAGFVAQGWYELGTRILDVRDPENIKQVGFFIGNDVETWAAYWVPSRNKKGKATGKPSNIVYTADAVRGVDILEVELPGKSAKKTRAVTAPTLPPLLTPAVSVPTKEYGFVCRQLLQR